MKRIGSLLLLFLVLAGASARTPAIAAQDNPGQKAPSIDRLAGLCRLWGLVRFCHPYLAARGIDWDAALIKTLPMVREAASAEDYEKALKSLLDHLDDPVTVIERIPSSVAGPPSTTADPGIQGRTATLRRTRRRTGSPCIVANDYRQFSTENIGWVRIIADFKKAFVEAARSRRVLIDLRNSAAPVPSSPGPGHFRGPLLDLGAGCRPAASQGFSVIWGTPPKGNR